jgi:hypothetical protein
MDRRVIIGGGIVVVAVAALGVRMAVNSGAKSGLDDALTHLPPGFAATHGAVTYNALTGQAQVRDLVVTKDGARLFTAGDLAVSGIGDRDASGTPKRIGEIVIHDASAGPYQHIQRIDLTGVELATLREIIDAAAYPGGKPAWTDKRPVLAHMEAHGIDGSQTTTTRGITVDTKFATALITLDGVRMSQLPAPPDLHSDAPGQIALAELAMAVDASTVKDITFSVDGAAAAHGHIAHITNGKADGGHVGEFSGEDIGITTAKPAGTIAIAGFSGHGLDVSKLLAAVPLLVADPDKPHPELLSGMHIDTAELHGAKFDYPDGPLVTLDSVSGGSPNPGSSVFSVRALTVQTTGRPIKPEVRAALESFGMQDFTTDVTEVGGYDAASQTVVLKRCDIDMHNLGTLHLTFTITGVAPAPVSTAQDIQAAMLAARLAAASVKWDDASLTDRLLKMAAAKQGVTPAQIRAGMAIPLASLPMLMPDQPDAAQQVNAFLDGKHSLTISAAPAVPVGLAQWNSTPPTAKAALLGLKVAGN